MFANLYFLVYGFFRFHENEIKNVANASLREKQSQGSKDIDRKLEDTSFYLDKYICIWIDLEMCISEHNIEFWHWAIAQRCMSKRIITFATTSSISGQRLLRLRGKLRAFLVVGVGCCCCCYCWDGFNISVRVCIVWFSSIK